ncbi:MAG TPA: hypothetical protein PLX89_09720 [Verrucomicrobiota bacterium]|nr:hypothetical protein [Verrucomicrobiales bacterium]HRI13273.1 hypothetical protein [Verrucomicrobiota bacterium]
MPFLDELLALNPDPTNPARVSVLARIPGVAGTPDDFRAFLETFSNCLQPPHVEFFAGLSSIELRMRQEILGRAGQVAFGGAVTLDTVATSLLTEKNNRDAAVGPLVSGVLSKVLTQIENEKMYPPALPRARAVTLTGLVPNDDFRSKLIQKAKTWKDAQVPWTHGEFTHRIQWCAAMLGLPAQNRWGIHFIEMGVHVDAAPFNNGGGPQRYGLWDALVDRNPSGDETTTPYLTNAADDFRSPENLQGWLLKDKRRLPGSPYRLLATFLFARATRRAVPTKTYRYTDQAFPVDDAAWNAWSRVLFKNRSIDPLSPNPLSPAEKAQLARAWFRLRQLDGGGRPANPIMQIEPEDVNNNVPLDAAGFPIAPELSTAYLDLGLNMDGSEV